MRSRRGKPCTTGTAAPTAIARSAVPGGGGRGLPVVDEEWVFGSDDATLFKLIRGQLPGQTMPATPG